MYGELKEVGKVAIALGVPLQSWGLWLTVGSEALVLSVQGSTHHKTQDSSNPRALATDGQVEAQSLCRGHRSPPLAALLSPYLLHPYCLL